MEKTLRNIKNHVMTGISFMIPVVVAGGILQAIGVAICGTGISQMEGETLIWYVWKLGNLGMSLVVPVICAAIAYSIADRPAIAPGLILGFVCTYINAGFIGGILAAFFVGYFILFLKKNLKVPKTMQGLMPVLILPLLTTLVCGFLFFTVLGRPIAALIAWIVSALTNMQRGSRFLLGAILGALCGVDFGGPMSKTASTFANGLLVDGVAGPEAVKLVCCMIPSVGLAVSALLARKKYTRVERDSIKSAFVMGICMITEGCIPLAMNDPLRVIGASVIATTITGGVTYVLGIENYVTAGGGFIIPLSNKPLLMAAMVLMGGVIMGVILAVWKKPVNEDGGEAGLDIEGAADIDIEIEHL